MSEQREESCVRCLDRAGPRAGTQDSCELAGKPTASWGLLQRKAGQEKALGGARADSSSSSWGRQASVEAEPRSWILEAGAGLLRFKE